MDKEREVSLELTKFKKREEAFMNQLENAVSFGKVMFAKSPYLKMDVRSI